MKKNISESLIELNPGLDISMQYNKLMLILGIDYMIKYS